MMVTDISLTVKIIELLQVFDKWLKMTATNLISAEFVKEDESVFIFSCEWIKYHLNNSFF